MQRKEEGDETKTGPTPTSLTIRATISLNGVVATSHKCGESKWPSPSFLALRAMLRGEGVVIGSCG